MREDSDFSHYSIPQYIQDSCFLCKFAKNCCIYHGGEELHCYTGSKSQ